MNEFSWGRRLYVIGYPSYVGGADTELWHTVRLWRNNGIDVTLIPTWNSTPEWKQRLTTIGASTAQVSNAGALEKVSGLPGSTVVSFCNGEFLRVAPQLRSLGCRLVWVNCMTWLFDQEKAFYADHGPFDAYVFQSEFQRDRLAPQLSEYGVQSELIHLIRGAFCFEEFGFQPRSHPRNEPFVFGRIARPDLDKWSSNLWPIYSAVQFSEKRARVMAWNHRLTAKCGAPPSWAEPLAANKESSKEFLNSLHCMFPINGGAQENWPRSGLEAMACGVPIVAQNEWGWREMIEHGVTGFLGNNDCELAHYTAMLAHDEELRLQIATKARERLTSDLAEPKSIARCWHHLIGKMWKKNDEVITG